MKEIFSHFHKARKEKNGLFYWSAAQLAHILGYSGINAFEATIRSAERICRKNGYNIADHFINLNNLNPTDNQVFSNSRDYLLSCYACYLILHLKDQAKTQVQMGRHYFSRQKCLNCTQRESCRCTNKFKYCRFSSPSTRGLNDN